MKKINVADIELLIQSDINKTIKRLGDNLISVFIIGSMTNLEKEMQRYNDYDIRFLVKEMNIEAYKEIEQFNKNAIRKIEKEFMIDTNYSFIIGPVRHITKSKINLLFHCIPMTINSLDGLPLTHKYSYSDNYRIIYGEDILKKYKKIRFEGNDIIECTEGIDYCIKMIENNCLTYVEWLKEGRKISLKETNKYMDDYMLFEVLRYSITKSLDNTIKWLSWKGEEIPDDIKSRLKEIDTNIDEDTLKKIECLIEGSFEKFLKNKNELKQITIEILNRIKYFIKSY